MRSINMTHDQIIQAALPFDYQYKAKRFSIVTRGYSEKIANVVGSPGEFNTINPKAEAYAAFIVRACNYHHDLLAALERTTKYLNTGAQEIALIEKLLNEAGR